MNTDIRYNNTEYLVEQFLDEIMRLSLVYLRDKDEAEEAVQQVFYTYLQKQPEFNDYEHAKNWLYKVTVNVCKNTLRFHSNKVSLDELENVLPTKDTSEQREQRDMVVKAVLRLKRSYREIIHLYYYAGYDTNEIAKMCGSSESNIRVRLKRARAALEKQLKGEDIDETSDGQLQKING